jgi:hypothetical protein
MTGAEMDTGHDTTAAPPEDTEELLCLLHAAGVRPLPVDVVRIVPLYARLRDYSSRLAGLDLGDTPPAVAFDPAWD